MLKKLKALGIGWIRENSFGASYKGLKQDYTDQRSLYECLKKESILRDSVENFSRFDSTSKNTLLSVALALYDAGVNYSKDKKQNIAIIATNDSGSAQTNCSYFKDYLENGRSLGRGNIFIYTLPSSSLAESSIHFGLTGPLLYAGFKDNGFPKLLEFARDMVCEGETKSILVLKNNVNHALCFLLGR